MYAWYGSSIDKKLTIWIHSSQKWENIQKSAGFLRREVNSSLSSRHEHSGDMLPSDLEHYFWSEREEKAWLRDISQKKSRIYIFEDIQCTSIIYLHNTDQRIQLINPTSFLHFMKNWRPSRKFGLIPITTYSQNKNASLEVQEFSSILKEGVGRIKSSKSISCSFVNLQLNTIWLKRLKTNTSFYRR